MHLLPASALVLVSSEYRSFLNDLLRRLTGPDGCFPLPASSLIQGSWGSEAAARSELSEVRRELTDEEKAELLRLDAAAEALAEADELAARIAELGLRAARGELTDAERAELARLEHRMAGTVWRTGGVDSGWSSITGGYDGFAQQEGTPAIRRDQQWRAGSADAGWKATISFSHNPYIDGRSSFRGEGGNWRAGGTDAGWNTSPGYDFSVYEDQRKPKREGGPFRDAGGSWRSGGTDAGWKSLPTYASNPYEDIRPSGRDSSGSWRAGGTASGWKVSSGYVSSPYEDERPPQLRRDAGSGWRASGTDPGWNELPGYTPNPYNERRPSGRGACNDQATRRAGGTNCSRRACSSESDPYQTSRSEPRATSTGVQQERRYDGAEPTWKAVAEGNAKDDAQLGSAASRRASGAACLRGAGRSQSPQQRTRARGAARSPSREFPRVPRPVLQSSYRVYESSSCRRQPQFGLGASIETPVRHPTCVLGCSPTRERYPSESTERQGAEATVSPRACQGQMQYETSARRMPSFALLPTQHDGRSLHRQDRPWTPDSVTKRALRNQVAGTTPETVTAVPWWPHVLPRRPATSQSAVSLNEALVLLTSRSRHERSASRLDCTRDLALKLSSLPRPKSSVELRRGKLPPDMKMWWLREVPTPSFPATPTESRVGSPVLRVRSPELRIGSPEPRTGSPES